MLRHRPSTACLLALAIAAAAAADVSASEVYQWTDANGVTHYSQTPPPGRGYKYRVITHRQAQTTDQAAAPAPEDPQCGVARANIALLEGGGRVRRDTDGDGVPDRDLDAGERASQLQLARMVLRANCKAPEQASAQTTVTPSEPGYSQSTREGESEREE